MKEYREIIPLKHSEAVEKRESPMHEGSARYEDAMNELARDGWEFLCVIPPCESASTGGHMFPRVIMWRNVPSLPYR